MTGNRLKAKDALRGVLPSFRGFPGGATCKELACQFRRHKRLGFNSWVRKIPWRRAWRHTSVFLPEKSHGQRSLAGYSPWGHKELDTTELTQHTCKHFSRSDQRHLSNDTLLAIMITDGRDGEITDINQNMTTDRL